MNEGIRMGSTQLAVSAMQELIQRGVISEIHGSLINQEYDGYLKPKTSMASMIGRALMNQSDPVLKKVGQIFADGKSLIEPRPITED